MTPEVTDRGTPTITIGGMKKKQGSVKVCRVQTVRKVGGKDTSLRPEKTRHYNVGQEFTWEIKRVLIIASTY